MRGQFPPPGTGPHALYFGPAGTESFGWLHGVREGADAAPLGVVLCSALGRKEVCSHHLIRHLAVDLADAGIPTLRFDYPGTGDASSPSGGGSWLAEDGDLDDPGAWLASIGQAIDLLKNVPGGAARVCVVGLDVGALLAGEALRDRADVAGFVAMAPAIKGRAWLREQRAFGMRAAQAQDAAGSARLESGSHAFSAQALAEIGRMDLQAIPQPPAADVLVLERDDQPGRSTAWIEHMRASGAQVDCRPLAGYNALMAPPYESVLPAAAVRDVVDWVRDLAERLRREPLPASSPAPAARDAAGHAVLRLADGAAVTEEPCMVDPAIGLHAILIRPEHQPGQPSPTHAVLLLPAGADRRIGPGRIFVGLARRLAAHGIVALRLDISGVGDSPARPGCQENAVYEPQALQDVETAVRYVRDVLRIPNVIVVGYCSSSYNALKAAVAQTPVQALVLVNQLVFFWKRGMSMNSTTSEAAVAFAARNYQRRFLQASRWRDLLRHPRKIAYAAQVLWRRPAAIARHVMRDVGRKLGFPLKDDLGRELLDLAARKVSLHFIFASGDPGEALLRASGGSVVQRLVRAGTLRIDRLMGADHELTQLAHRQQLQQMVLSSLVALTSSEAMPGSAGPQETPRPLQGR